MIKTLTGLWAQIAEASVQGSKPLVTTTLPHERANATHDPLGFRKELGGKAPARLSGDEVLASHVSGQGAENPAF